MRYWVSAFVFVILAALAALIWISDSITLQGERTIYTARCVNGEWRGEDCSGRLVAAERYHYHALRARHEVLFWIAGSDEPPRKFGDCDVRDGRNWKCAPCPDASKSITMQLSQGRAVPNAQTQTGELHAVSKWRWMLLSAAG